MTRDGAREAARKLVTFAGGSAVATVSSETVLLLCYGVLHLAASVSAVLAWVAGAVPNYWIGRRWTWRRRGRPSLGSEVLPYLVVVLATLLLAVGTTHLVAEQLSDAGAAAHTRELAVAAAFLGVYVVAFLIRFWLLDRLFDRLHRRERAVGDPDTTTRRTP